MEQITISATETVVVDNDTAITIVTGLMGPKGKDAVAATLTALADVDMTNAKEGSLLIFSTGVSKWQAGNTLEHQILEAGQF